MEFNHQIIYAVKKVRHSIDLNLPTYILSNFRRPWCNEDAISEPKRYETCVTISWNGNYCLFSCGEVWQAPASRLGNANNSRLVCTLQSTLIADIHNWMRNYFPGSRTLREWFMRNEVSDEISNSTAHTYLSILLCYLWNFKRDAQFQARSVFNN